MSQPPPPVPKLQLAFLQNEGSFSARVKYSARIVPHETVYTLSDMGYDDDEIERYMTESIKEEVTSSEAKPAVSRARARRNSTIDSRPSDDYVREHRRRSLESYFATKVEGFNEAVGSILSNAMQPASVSSPVLSPDKSLIAKSAKTSMCDEIRSTCSSLFSNVSTTMNVSHYFCSNSVVCNRREHAAELRQCYASADMYPFSPPHPSRLLFRVRGLVAEVREGRDAIMCINVDTSNEERVSVEDVCSQLGKLDELCGVVNNDTAGHGHADSLAAVFRRYRLQSMHMSLACLWLLGCHVQSKPEKGRVVGVLCEDLAECNENSSEDELSKQEVLTRTVMAFLSACEKEGLDRVKWKSHSFDDTRAHPDLSTRDALCKGRSGLGGSLLQHAVFKKDDFSVEEAVRLYFSSRDDQPSTDYSEVESSKRIYSNKLLCLEVENEDVLGQSDGKEHWCNEGTTVVITVSCREQEPLRAMEARIRLCLRAYITSFESGGKRESSLAELCRTGSVAVLLSEFALQGHRVVLVLRWMERMRLRHTASDCTLSGPSAYRLAGFLSSCESATATVVVAKKGAVTIEWMQSKMDVMRASGGGGVRSEDLSPSCRVDVESVLGQCKALVDPKIVTAWLAFLLVSDLPAGKHFITSAIMREFDMSREKVEENLSLLLSVARPLLRCSREDELMAVADAHREAVEQQVHGYSTQERDRYLPGIQALGKTVEGDVTRPCSLAITNALSVVSSMDEEVLLPLRCFTPAQLCTLLKNATGTYSFSFDMLVWEILATFDSCSGEDKVQWMDGLSVVLNNYPGTLPDGWVVDATSKVLMWAKGLSEEDSAVHRAAIERYALCLMHCGVYRVEKDKVDEVGEVGEDENKEGGEGSEHGLRRDFSLLLQAVSPPSLLQCVAMFLIVFCRDKSAIPSVDDGPEFGGKGWRYMTGQAMAYALLPSFKRDDAANRYLSSAPLPLELAYLAERSDPSLLTKWKCKLEGLLGVSEVEEGGIENQGLRIHQAALAPWGMLIDLYYRVIHEGTGHKERVALAKVKEWVMDFSGAGKEWEKLSVVFERSGDLSRSQWALENSIAVSAAISTKVSEFEDGAAPCKSFEGACLCAAPRDQHLQAKRLRKLGGLYKDTAHFSAASKTWMEYLEAEEKLSGGGTEEAGDALCELARIQPELFPSDKYKASTSAQNLFKLAIDTFVSAEMKAANDDDHDRRSLLFKKRQAITDEMKMLSPF